MDRRYARQELLSGWEQQRLTDATLVIAGSGPLAFLSGLMAAAMGFGRLVLVGGGALETLNLSLKGPWSELYRRVNPRVRIYASPTRLSLGLIRRLPGLDGLIVASNDLEARCVAWKAAQELPIPVVAGMAAGRLGVWGTAVPDPVAIRLSAHPEFPLLSQVVAAFLVEEMRKALLPLSGEAGQTDQSNYLCLPLPQTTLLRRSPSRSSPRRSLVLVGAGALGTWFGLGLGLQGLPVDLHLYDGDTVSQTNLNRQVLFYDAVGQNKALVLAARLQKLFPHLQTYGYGIRAEAQLGEHLTQHPVLVACPDNFAARALLDDLARQHSRVLVSGGTSATGGSCLVYEPGHTACLSCRLRIDRLAQQEQRPQPCAQQAQPSIVTSNALVGALMAWLLYARLSTGRAEAGMWEYDGRLQNERLSLRSGWPACRCHRAQARRNRPINPAP